MTTKTFALTGNEIVAKAAIAAGCRFFAGYPISPSSEIAAYMAKLLPPVGGAFIQMEDEIGSMAAIIGGSLAGKKVMTATSGPGFSLKQENLGYACAAEIPCVIVNVMRSGPSTGMPTLPSQGDIMQARWGTHGDHNIIVLTPCFHDEIYTETVRAFNLAEKYRIPVVLMTDEALSHMSARTDIPEQSTLEVVDRPRPNDADFPNKHDYLPYDESFEVPPMADFFKGYYWHVTGLTHDQTGFPTEDPVKAKALFDRMNNKILNNLDDILKWEEFMVEDADILLVATGSIGRSAKLAVTQAREELGLKVGMFRPLTLWPFPEAPLKKAAEGKAHVIVAEMNMGQMALEVERILHRDITLVPKYDGEMLTSEDIMAQLKQLSLVKS
ncbi:MAG: 2-oxoacid:acceptor oxidoreductase subunit alpha [Vampirovibrionales bacterium]|nr:2-oxoacid:acceptor oxidoreductase subunit alpha [Vampirovibrionales bacterium]